MSMHVVKNRRLNPIFWSHAMELGAECDEAYSVDIETNGMPWYSDECEISVIGVCDGETSEIYDPRNRTDNHYLTKEVFGNRKIGKVFHNGAFDIPVLGRAGFRTWRGPMHDTIFMARVAYNLEFKVGLDYLGKKYCKIGKIEVEAPWLLDRDELEAYNKVDTEITWLLFHRYMGRKDRKDWWGTYQQEMALLPVLCEMDQNAPWLDYGWCVQFMLQARPEVEKREKKFKGLNPRSWEQVSRYLYGYRNEEGKWVEGIADPWAGQPRGKNGLYSTGEGWLIRHLIAGRQPKKVTEFIRMLLDYRSWYKDLGYVKKLVEFARHDGRVHAGWKPYTAKTGRWSCAKPNLQQIPGKPHHVRHAFTYAGEEGNWELWSWDYDQMELRMAASEAGEESLLRAFHEGRDIHMETARRVTNGNRDWAKVVIYAYIYGSGAETMAKTLRVTVEEAQGWLDNLRERMPKLHRYMNRMKKEIRKTGWLKTKLGRKFRVEEAYQATDYFIQGSGADILKQFMVRLYWWLVEEGLKTRIIMPIHDEIVLAIWKPEKKRILAEVKPMMEVLGLFDVPLTVTYGKFHEKD